MRKLLISCLIVGICSSFVSLASADSLGTCTNTGYTFMGGWMVYQTPPSSKDYFMASNAPADGDSWGFGWLKFGDLPTEQVDEAWLSLEYYSDMTQSPTPEDPLDVGIYAVDADVTGITADNVVEFKNTHIVGSAVATATFTGTGFNSWDITSIVNDWIAGDNYGLAVITWDDLPNPNYYNPYFAGLPGTGTPKGMVPTLATDPVPEPGSIVMLLGLLGTGLAMIGLKRYRSTRRG